MKISDIIVGTRYRKDIGDISTLKTSIETIGLLHPVVVNKNNELIAGLRRAEACKELGWIDIPVTVIDLEKVLKGEFDENVERKAFTPTEIAAISKALRPVEEEKAKKRQEEAGEKYGEKYPQELKESFLTLSKPKKKQAPQARDKVAAYAGVSGRTLEKIEEVVEAAEEEPKKYQPLVEQMDRTGKVDGVYRKLKQEKDEERILVSVPQKEIEGVFKTILIDPPWDYGALSLAGRGKPKYAVLSIKQLEEIDIMKYVDKEGCHLYLWATNNFLYEALKLGEKWGFSYKTVLTWVKPSIGLGSYFRNNTEHCLFFMYGKQTTRVNNIPTAFEAPKAEHSEKPEEAYEIIETSSYPPYLEIFGRKERKNWVIKEGDIRNV